MARKTTTNAPKESNPAQEFDQAAIDAALAGAVTRMDGSPIPPMKKEGGNATSTDKCGDKPDGAPIQPIAADQKKFGEDCFNLNIDAKKCHYQSAKNEDKSILEYVRAINKKIYDETCLGGFSTNVKFRVTPQDWVNVSHIQDWYRARGFEVDVKDTTSAPYGKEVGTMNYNFTISWATVQ